MPADKNKIVKFVSEAKKKAKKRNFLESVDLTINLKGIDLKKTENRINVDLTLPNQVHKNPKICVIATGDLAVQAKEAGANLILQKEDLEKYGANKKEAKKIANENQFFIAQADLMPLVGKFLGSTIAPRGKMPKPGTGIVPPTGNIKPVIERCSRLVRISLKKDPVIHLKVGNVEMKDEELAENIATVLNFLEGKLERGAQNIKNAYVKTTMGPPVKIEL
ncbi:MAG: 50S ribosomal protein L1 [Candidatus Odinarchaeia archaeon]